MKVLLVPNYARANAAEGARQIASWLEGAGVALAWAYHKTMAPLGKSDAQGFDLVISFGGDGTLLRAAHMIGYAPTPLLGISYGHLGFLTGTDAQAAQQTVARALAGELHTSLRTTLSVDVDFENSLGERQQVRDIFCLNDLALARGNMGDIVEFSVTVSGNFIDKLRADGFVVATATGSTGYALSAGGPIVTPDFRGMVCVPIAPHTIQARAFLPSAADVVELTLSSERPVDRNVFCDGRLIAVDGSLAKKIQVRRGPEDIHLLSDDAHGFYRSVSRVFYGLDNPANRHD